MSHYCEKARWGLQWAGLDYSEEAHLQVFHYWAVRRCKANGMVPVLLDGNRPIADSSAILKYLGRYLPDEKNLYPEQQQNEIDTLESFFDEGLGIESRRWVYFHWLKRPVREVLRTAAQLTPRWQRLSAPYIFPLFRAYLTRYLNISEANVSAGRQTIEEAFALVAQCLEDGRPYLCGERFTAADISFACMAAPLLLPAEYGIRLPTLDEAPADARVDVIRYREHPAGQFALRLFSERGKIAA